MGERYEEQAEGDRWPREYWKVRVRIMHGDEQLFDGLPSEFAALLAKETEAAA